MNLKSILLLTGLTLISACNSDKVDLTWLEGEWVCSEYHTLETWNKLGDEAYSGFANALEDESEITEKLSLTKEGNIWFYSATVPNQNEGKTIKFRGTQVKGKVLVFENLTHDFPQKIVYESLNNDSLRVTISAMKGKMLKKRVFGFKKRN